MGSTLHPDDDGAASLTTDPIARARLAAKAADAKKAERVVVLDVGDIISITDYFVIASCANVPQVRAVVEEIEQVLKDRASESPLGIEGLDDFSWVLMDYGDFVVHVFLDETRGYYDLDRLWADAPSVEWMTADV